MQPSRRSADLPILELPQLLRSASAVGAIDIALGIPAGPPPDTLVSRAIGALIEGMHQYSDPAGLLDLRAAIADELLYRRGLVIDPDTEITITCGATEAVFVALLAITDPGDRVIVLEPYYEGHIGMVRLVGASPTLVPLREPDWRIDLDALEQAAADPASRAILLNTPHNPTGRAFDTDEIARIVEICCKHEVICITDEVYEHYVYDGRRHISPLELPAGRPRTVMAGSLSKTFEITGWRIGFCVAPPELTIALRRVHEHTTIGTSRPLQEGATVLPTEKLAERRQYFQARRDLLVQRLATCGFDVVVPEGGWFVLAGVNRLGWSARKLAQALIEQAQVLVVPGTAFFSSPALGDRWIRTTFVRDQNDTHEGLDRLEGFLRSQS